VLWTILLLNLSVLFITEFSGKRQGGLVCLVLDFTGFAFRVFLH